MLLPTGYSYKKNTIADILKSEKEITIRHHQCQGDDEGKLVLTENILLFILEGRFIFRNGKVVHSAEKQQVAFFRKNILLEYKAEEQNTSFLLVVLKNESVLEFVKTVKPPTRYSEKAETIVIGHSGTRLFNYIISLQNDLFEDVFLLESINRIKLFEILLCLSVEVQPILEQVLSIREHFSTDITRVVEENIGNSLSLGQLARLAGRSVSSFKRDFLYIYNMPPSRWIRKKRLENAQELLVTTNMTVTDICYTLGFESLAHFSRIFKAYYGCAPSSFRVNSLIA